MIFSILIYDIQVVRAESAIIIEKAVFVVKLSVICYLATAATGCVANLVAHIYMDNDKVFLI